MDSRGGSLCVTEESSDILQYNKNVYSSEQITVKKNFKPLDLSWNIPEDAQNVDLETLLSELLESETKNMDEDGIALRSERVKEELKLYKELDLIPVLCVINYVINTLRSYNVVWGIGRGSCVASYVLYLIGVHDVDSVKYELDHTDFLRP